MRRLLAPATSAPSPSASASRCGSALQVGRAGIGTSVRQNRPNRYRPRPSSPGRGKELCIDRQGDRKRTTAQSLPAAPRSTRFTAAPSCRTAADEHPTKYATQLVRLQESLLGRVRSLVEPHPAGHDTADKHLEIHP